MRLVKGNPRLNISIFVVMLWAVSCSGPTSSSQGPAAYLASSAGQCALPVLLCWYVAMIGLPYREERLVGLRPHEIFQDEDYRLRLLKELLPVHALLLTFLLTPPVHKHSDMRLVRWRQAGPCLAPLAGLAIFKVAGFAFDGLRPLAPCFRSCSEILWPAPEEVIVLRKPTIRVVAVMPMVLVMTNMSTALWCRVVSWVSTEFCKWLFYSTGDPHWRRMAAQDFDLAGARGLLVLGQWSCLVAALVHSLHLLRVLCNALPLEVSEASLLIWAWLGMAGVLVQLVVISDCVLIGSLWFFWCLLPWSALILLVCAVLRAPVATVASQSMWSLLMRLRWHLLRSRPLGGYVFSNRSVDSASAAQPLLEAEFVD